MGKEREKNQRGAGCGWIEMSAEKSNKMIQRLKKK